MKISIYSYPEKDSSGNYLLVIETWRYRLAVDMLATTRNMSLSDFKKMLRIVCKMADTPEEKLDYLTNWRDFIYDRPFMPRRAKLLMAIKKELDKLPSWIFDEDLEDE